MPVLRRAAAVVAWSAVLMLGYVVLVSHVSRAEALVGLAVSVLAAGVGAVAIGPFRPDPLLPPLAWRALAWLPLDAARGTAAFVVAVARSLPRDGHRGSEDNVALGGGLRSVGGRADAVLLLSATPGSYAVSVDGDRNEVEVHRLGVPGRAERAVAP